jgi:general secretion pathway protein G
MPKPKSALHHKRWTLRLFEWGVLTCVLLILMGVFLRRVRYLQVKAESLNVQATVDNLRAAVLLTSVLRKHQKTERPEARSGGNPVALLKAETGLEPDGYLGERSDAGLNEIAPGQWYYDRGQGALIYRLRSAVGFESPLAGPPHIRLCLRQADASQSAGSPLQLEACEPYRWVLAN